MVNPLHTEIVTRRQGSLIRLRPECEGQYISLHQRTFPGVLERIRKSHIRSYSIFLYAGYLFSYIEYTGDAFDADMKAIGDPITKEWWKLTDPMQEPLPTRRPGEWWAEMEQLIQPGETTGLRPDIRRCAYTATVKSGSSETVKRMLRDNSRLLLRSLTREHRQNFNLYFKDNMLYIYSEFPGNDSARCGEEFLQIDDPPQWDREFEPHLAKPWQEMREVFHTDSLQNLT